MDAIKEKNLILFDCKRRLILKLKKFSDLDKSFKIFTTKDFEELKKLVKESTDFKLVIYNKKDFRNNFIENFKKLESENIKNLYALIILSRNESRKFNFLKNQNKNIIYISSPASIEELIQFINILSEISRLNEIIVENDKVIQAFESVSELSRKELMEAYKNLSAHEMLTEISRKELIDKNKLLKAWEEVMELSKKEKLDYEKEFNALETILELSREERILADKIISAWERTFEVGRNELMECYSRLKNIVSTKKEIIETVLNKISKKETQ